MTFGGDMAHALLRAALMLTPAPDGLSAPQEGVETSLDTARRSPCATPSGKQCETA
jgi:hypothetical protein